FSSSARSDLISASAFSGSNSRPRSTRTFFSASSTRGAPTPPRPNMLGSRRSFDGPGIAGGPPYGAPPAGPGIAGGPPYGPPGMAGGPPYGAAAGGPPKAGPAAGLVPPPGIAGGPP